jgi:excisionase family DNA binding protein
MLRVSEVARRLDCSETTVRKLIANGELPFVQLNGKNTSLRLDEYVLEKWLEGRLARNGVEAA